jgi:hypothetical protein
MAKRSSSSKRSFGKRTRLGKYGRGPKRKKKVAPSAGKHPVRRKTSEKIIEAKPTKYRGAEYASRLEARWAVFLDYYHLMSCFAYEPRSFALEQVGWQYTPDFYFQWGNLPGYLEVKPQAPTDEYLQDLCKFIPIIPIQLTLAVGDFFKGNVPKLWVPGLSSSFPKPKTETVKAEALPLLTLWPDSQAALKTAAGYRFDLEGKDPLPPFRNPQSGKNPLDHLEEYRKQQEEATRGDRMELMEARRKAMKKALRKGKQ